MESSIATLLLWMMSLPPSALEICEQGQDGSFFFFSHARIINKGDQAPDLRNVIIPVWVHCTICTVGTIRRFVSWLRGGIVKSKIDVVIAASPSSPKSQFSRKSNASIDGSGDKESLRTV